MWASLRQRLGSGWKVVVLLGLLVGLPSVVLAWLGVQSVRSESLAARALFQQRCEAVAADLYGEVERRFGAFEAQLVRSVARAHEAWDVDATAAGDALSSDLPEIDGVLVLDGSGSLVYPPAWRVAPSDPAGGPGGFQDRSFMGESFDKGEQAEVRRGDAEAAAEFYAAAVPRIPGQRGKAIAMNALARSLLKDGRPADARAVWLRIEQEHPQDQDWNGFPLGLLARYQQGISHLQEGSEALAARGLASLTRDLLHAPWTYGGFAEAVIARKALLHLEAGRLVDQVPPGLRPDLEAARARFDERARRQRDQAATLALLPRLREDPTDHRNARVQYFRDASRAGSILVARVRWSSPGARRLYLVTLDQSRLLSRLRDRVAGAARASPEIRVRLAEARGGLLPLWAQSEGVAYPLDPWVPGMMLVVGRGNPDLMEAHLERTWAFRLALVMAFTTLIVVGAGMTARAILREMEIARLKTDFVSNVSHELRTPLTSIRLMGEMLAMGAVPTEDKRAEYYQNIVSESERLSRLIDNVLDFARLEEGRKKFRFARGDIGECVRQVERISVDFVRGEGYRFEVSVAPSLPRLWFDADAIVQALINLIGNAVKYSRRERVVKVTAARHRDGVVLSVEDRGEGIDPKDLRHIFDKFYRGGDSLTRETRGAGLGLAIVKAIALAHGGEVRVRSRPGEGSTFSIVLPVRGNPPDARGSSPEERVA